MSFKSPTVPVWGLHRSPPLQPPSKHELGPGLTPKLQLRRALLTKVSHSVRSGFCKYNIRNLPRYDQPSSYPARWSWPLWTTPLSIWISPINKKPQAFRCKLPRWEIWDVERDIQVSKYLWIYCEPVLSVVIKMVRTAGLEINELRRPWQGHKNSQPNGEWTGIVNLIGEKHISACSRRIQGKEAHCEGTSCGTWKEGDISCE